MISLVHQASSEKQRLEGLVIQASEEQEIKKRNEKLAVLKEDNQKKKDHLAQLQQRASFINTTKEKLDKLIAMLQEIQQEKSKEKYVSSIFTVVCFSYFVFRFPILARMGIIILFVFFD